MDWGALGKKIAGIGADVLGEALPFPGSGPAVDALASAFGVSSDDPDAISEAIAQDPEAAAKLKKIELDHKAQLEQIRKDHKEQMREYQAQDVQGAREFSAKEMKSDDPYVRHTRPKVVRMTMWLMAAFVVLFTVAIGIVLALPYEIPETNADLAAQGLSYLAGVVFLAFATAFRSYTTRRSMDKMTAAGQMPEGLVDKLGKAFGRGKK